jgi:hypothetical protein
LDARDLARVSCAILREGLPVRSIVIAVVAALIPASAAAFSFLGYTTGMSEADVRTASQGFPVSRLSGMPEGVEAVSDGNRVLAYVTFCKGQLVAVSHSIDPDQDWLKRVDTAIAKWGQPAASVSTGTSITAGDLSSLSLKWKIGQDDYTLTFFPQTRSGEGTVRSTRGAMEGFYSHGFCG